MGVPPPGRYVSVPSDPFMVVVADYVVLSFKYSLKVKIKVKIYNFPLSIITTNIIPPLENKKFCRLAPLKVGKPFKVSTR